MVQTQVYAAKKAKASLELFEINRRESCVFFLLFRG